MNRDIAPPGEDYMIRCPKLGHQIVFSYCRSENLGLPCARTLDCWFSHFPVEPYLQKELGLKKWEQVFDTAPKQKMVSLLELIEQARNGQTDEGQDQTEPV